MFTYDLGALEGDTSTAMRFVYVDGVPIAGMTLAETRAALMRLFGDMAQPRGEMAAEQSWREAARSVPTIADGRFAPFGIDAESDK